MNIRQKFVNEYLSTEAAYAYPQPVYINERYIQPAVGKKKCGYCSSMVIHDDRGRCPNCGGPEGEDNG